MNTKSVTVHVVTALLFLFFTAYQLFLLSEIFSNTVGRLIGIIIFLLITISSFMALSTVPVIRLIRSVLLTIGLLANFGLKLLNARMFFRSLDFSVPPTVLNCLVFVLSELAILILIVYYAVLRRIPAVNEKRRVVTALMAVVILLYLACLVMESILLIKYRVNIELTRKFTLLSRFLYCFGFVGMALSFTMPIPVNTQPATDEDEDEEEDENEDEDEDENEGESEDESEKKKRRPPVGKLGEDFVL